MVNYFILANLYALLFYALYLWTLKGSNKHRWSRFYLLSAGPLSLLLPFVRLDLPAINPAAGYTMQQAFQLPEVVLLAARQTAGVNNDLFLFAGYAMVAMALFARLIYRVLRLQAFLKAQHFSPQGQYRIAFNTGHGPASFGKTIIFPEQEADDMILRHEIAHLEHRHHYDKMIMWLLGCFFFPVAPLLFIRRELELVHEFEADRAANTDTTTYALLLVNRHFHTNQIHLLQSFFHHPLKRRIMMLQQSRKGKRGLLLTALALTTTGILLLQSQGPALAQKKTPAPGQHVPVAEKKVYTSTTTMPDPGFNLMKYLSENLNYPESARKAGISGRVIARFIVSATGKLRDIEIVRPLSPDLAAEVLRVLQAMPAWQPGIQDGKPVDVYYTLPVSFNLK